MLPKEKRLQQEDFEEIMKKGRVYNSDHFLLRVYKKPDQVARFSVVVPAKVAKSAVERNKLRRRGYSALRLITKDVEGLYVVVFSKKGAEKLKFPQWKMEITKLFVAMEA